MSQPLWECLITAWIQMQFCPKNKDISSLNMFCVEATTHNVMWFTTECCCEYLLYSVLFTVILLSPSDLHSGGYLVTTAQEIWRENHHRSKCEDKQALLRKLSLYYTVVLLFVNRCAISNWWWQCLNPINNFGLSTLGS